MERQPLHKRFTKAFRTWEQIWAKTFASIHVWKVRYFSTWVPVGNIFNISNLCSCIPAEYNMHCSMTYLSAMLDLNIVLGLWFNQKVRLLLRNNWRCRDFMLSTKVVERSSFGTLWFSIVGNKCNKYLAINVNYFSHWMAHKTLIRTDSLQ